MRRRQFIKKSAFVLAATSGVVAVISYFRQFFPRIAGEKRRITLGDSSRFPVDTFTYLDQHKLFVYRDHEGVRAVSAICTHLGCTLESTTDGFECPCHGSCYNSKGEVLSGPAPRDLSWFKVNRSSDGKVIIDPGEIVEAEEKFLST
ncbi:MAG: Rieske 2Fe-2S domain-containing protein [Bacteroides sp.]|nr:Rieske 2Fe-2S domain-containing protein [Bacteroides sp.]